MIVHLPGAGAAQHEPTSGRRQGTSAFRIDQTAAGEPCRQQGQKLRQNVDCKRRIEKNAVEYLVRAAQESRSVAANDVDCAQRSGGKSGRVLPQRIVYVNVIIDHHDAARAARRGFEAERAAAGEQIETRFTVEPLPQPVE